MSKQEIVDLVWRRHAKGELALPPGGIKSEKHLLAIASELRDRKGVRVVPDDLIAIQQAERPEELAAPEENYWIPLHCYAPENSDDWSPLKAEAFTRGWIAQIQSRNCCWKDFGRILSKFPPVFDSPEQHLYRSWQWHDEVSKKINKPRITWLECCSLFGTPWRPRPKSQVLFVTALSRMEKHLQRQEICLRSWVDFGAKIYAVNTGDEIAFLRDRYPEVSAWIQQDEVSTDYAYPTQLIRNLANVACELGEEIYLINSDIEVYGDQSVLRHEDGTQLHGIRWNYEAGEHRSLSTEFQWGIDLVSFTPEQAKLLPSDFPLAIGQAMWDYAVPYFTLAGGHKIQFLHRRLLYHEEHTINWKKDAWHFGSGWLSDRTELSVRDYKPSALWRESLDPQSWYSKDAGCWLSKAGAGKHVRRDVSVPLDYETWKAAGGLFIDL